MGIHLLEFSCFHSRGFQIHLVRFTAAAPLAQGDGVRGGPHRRRWHSRVPRAAARPGQSPVQETHNTTDAGEARCRGVQGSSCVFALANAYGNAGWTQRRTESTCPSGQNIQNTRRHAGYAGRALRRPSGRPSQRCLRSFQGALNVLS